MTKSRAAGAAVLFVIANLLIFALVPHEARVMQLSDVLDSPSEERQEGSWIWWITRGYLKDGTNSDVALMGSSQMGAALYSAEAFHRNLAIDTVTERDSKVSTKLFKDKTGYGPKVFNFSFGGAMISDQLMIAKALFNEKHKPELVILGLNPRDFMDNTLPSPSATEPFQYLSPYTNLGDLSDCSFGDPIEWMDWKMEQIIPTRTHSHRVVKGLTDMVANAFTSIAPRGSHESLEPGSSAKKDSDSGNVLDAMYKNAGEVAPGKWKVIAMGWGSFKDNTDEYQVRYKDASPPLYKTEKRFFEEYLDYLKANDIKAIVVGMPSLWPNRALLPDSFWSEFRGYVASTCQGKGAKWVDLTDDQRFEAKDFLDTVHLNAAGGTKLVNAIVDTASPTVAELSGANANGRSLAEAGTDNKPKKEQAPL